MQNNSPCNPGHIVRKSILVCPSLCDEFLCAPEKFHTKFQLHVAKTMFIIKNPRAEKGTTKKLTTLNVYICTLHIKHFISPSSGK